jgi:hypothetical protein
MDASNLQVRWKHHQMGVMDYLRQLLVSEVFVDVTLCCQNRRFKAHRILLSACSSYLQVRLTCTCRLTVESEFVLLKVKGGNAL